MRLKEEGNVFFKGGNWKKAARKYHDALLYVKAICDNSGELVNAIAGTTIAPAPATQAERDQAEVLLTALSNNLAGQKFYIVILYIYINLYTSHV